MYRAYQVSDLDNEKCEVVFAETPAKAKRRANLTWDFGWIGVRVKRAPDFDHLVEQGYVSDRDFLTAGWYAQCQMCGRLLLDGDEEQDRWAWSNDTAYCSQECLDTFRQRVEAATRRPT
jgi:hypothetical protein